MKFSFIQIVLMIFYVPYLIIQHLINPPRDVYDEFKEDISKNKNTIYYVLEKYVNRNKELVQYVTFYTAKDGRYEDITHILLAFMNAHSLVSLKKDSTYGTVMLKDLGMYKFTQDASKAFGMPVNLVLVDKKAVA